MAATSTLAPRADVVVLGAGVAGLSTALRLAEAGRDIVVIDRAEPWREASGVNAGTLALQNKPLDLLAFYKEGTLEWRHIKDLIGEDIGYVRNGGFRVAQTPEHVAALRTEAARQNELGAEVEWLDGNALRDRAPWMGPSVRAATFCPTDGFASPLLAGRALIRAMERAGGQLNAHTTVTRAETTATGYRLHTTAGDIACRSVVIAAGAWADAVAALFGVKLVLRQHVNMLSITERIASFMDNQVVTHVAGRFTLKQFPNGSCMLGGGFQGRGDCRTGEKEVDFEQLVANLRFQCDVVPSLKTANLLRSWAGFSGQPEDGKPLIGSVPGQPQLYLAHPGGAGFTIGPLVGRLVAEAVLTGSQPTLAARFDPARLFQ